MKPKSKPHVHYAPTEDGVYIRTWTQEFEIKGRTLALWLDQLLPMLDGKQTLDELVAPLPPEQAQFVRMLVEELVKREAVFDAAGVPEVVLSEREDSLYRQTVLVLEDRFVDGRQRFLTLRQRPVAVVGAGDSFFACVRSLVRMGVRELYVSGGEERVDSFLATWKTRDPELNVQELGTLPPAGVLIYVSDDPQASVHWEEVALRTGVPFLAGTLLGDHGVVGPVKGVQTQASWSTVLDRFAGARGTGVELSRTHRAMIGNVAAMEALRLLTGWQEEGVRDQVVLIESEALAVTRHDLASSPLQERANSSVSEEERVAALRAFAEREPEEQTKFLRRMEGMVDEKVGVLARLQADDLYQIPLALGRVVVHVPTASGVQPLSIVRGGETLRDALEAAVRDGFLAYARTLEAVGSPDAERSIWAHGRTYAEWKGRALLHLMIERSRRAEDVWLELPELAANWSVEAGLLKLLRVRFGAAVELFQQKGTELAHALRVVQDGVVLAEGFGRTLREAAHEALILAVASLQLAAQQAQDETAVTALRFEAQTVRVADHTHSMEEQELLEWPSWLAQAEAWLRESGLVVEEFPWLRDRTVLDAGVLVGFVDVTERGELQ
ncbi:hypothetical protein JJB07_09900 [Tumebacillus sp. ITR2]|uniref:Uncharacterized protein n=1 Tax=Tumebacillus amylolyticus TaxID=2801339 RepID=A0ABS1J9M6_9BACL|nr:hypothetical protein [Tumebacillus amylolyticus]MBL0386967.1 hypothetical protein [Tumebacillus amylolyticus]